MQRKKEAAIKEFVEKAASDPLEAARSMPEYDVWGEISNLPWQCDFLLPTDSLLETSRYHRDFVTAIRNANGLISDELNRLFE